MIPTSRISLKISMTAICAALYAVSIATTAFIPTPWGVGQFRWGVIFPALFAIIGGPWVAGIGAAIGTWLGSWILMLYGLSNPILSLFAGVPANFIGFFLFGYLIHKFKSWSNLIIIALLTLFIGNFIAAFNTVLFFTYFVDPAVHKFAFLVQTSEWATRLSIVFGFMLFWVLTMYPIIIFALPPLMRAITPILKTYQIASPIMLEEPKTTLPKSIVTGFVVLLIGFLFYYTPLSNILATVLRISLLQQTYLFYFTLITAIVLFVAPYIVAKRFYKLHKIQTR
jgi:hypothetical protein